MKWIGPIASVGLVVGLSSPMGGCGGSSAPIPEPPVEQVALREVGEMYRAYSDEHKKPPRSGKDLASYAPAFSHGSMALVNREITVLWGADLAPASEAVLAHEKQVAQEGGMVLLQDGETLKQMTVAEFQAAPKAAGK